MQPERYMLEELAVASVEHLPAGKYLLYRQQHFSGFRVFADGTCVLQKDHRCHTGTFMELEAFSAYVYEKLFRIVAQDEIHTQSNESKAGDAVEPSCECGTCSVPRDACGGGGENGNFGIVWDAVWREFMWMSLPFAALREVFKCSRYLCSSMADLEERLQGVKLRMRAADVIAVLQGIYLHGSRAASIPTVTWDLYGEKEMERRYMRGSCTIDFQGRVAERWCRRNPEQAAGIRFLSSHTRRACYVEAVSDDGSELALMQETVLQLQLGPVRVYMTFSVRKVLCSDPTESSSEVESDDVQGGAEVREMQLHGWLESTFEGFSLYTPFGVDAGSIVSLVEKPLSLENAAAWFLASMKKPWEPSAWKHGLLSFPKAIQQSIGPALVSCGDCPVEHKALWYMHWWLSVANLQEPVELFEVEDVALVWAYTWPTSSLKEALSRLGCGTAVAYQELRSVAAWNCKAWDSNAVLVPWEGFVEKLQGWYVMEVHNVFSALLVTRTVATWSCGKVRGQIALCELQQFLSAQSALRLYSVVCARLDKSLAFDVCGGARHDRASPNVGDRVMTLRKEWLQKILKKEKSIELRSRGAEKGFVWLAVGNLICGSARIEKTEKLTVERFVSLQSCHCVQGEELPYKKTCTYGLFLGEVDELEVPVQFCRLRGSCGWARVRYNLTDKLPVKARSNAVKQKREMRSLSVKEESGVVWPQQQDARLFTETGAFKPTAKTLQVNEDETMVLPDAVAHLAGEILVSANTVGDGACGMHAVFGRSNKHGQLECYNGRAVAVEFLEMALRRQVRGARPSANVQAVRMSLWDELALPGAAGAGSPEAELFWQHFVQQYPSEAEEVRQIVRQGELLKQEEVAQRRKLLKVCRGFFCNAAEPVVEAVCLEIGYAAGEGEEDCFEERHGIRYVKGQREVVWPVAGPRRKADAIRHANPAFDGLRMAVFLGRNLPQCIAVIEEVSSRCRSADGKLLQEGLQEYHAHQERNKADRHRTQPASFGNAAIDAYLLAVMEANYYLSCDEVATVAEMRQQNLVIVTEGVDDESFVPYCVAAGGSAETVIVLLKDVQSEARVRSHFERLAPLRLVVANDDHTSRLQASSSAGSEGCGKQGGQEAAEPSVGEESDCSNARQARTAGSFDQEEWLRIGRADGEAEFEEAVVELLGAYERGGDVQEVLEKMPLFSKEIGDADFEILRNRLASTVPHHVGSNITGADAVYLAMPFWRTCVFPIAVALEAWARTTGLPTIFYIDAFYTLLGSLLNKEIRYRVAYFHCRARYWAVGTAAPGSGKSPALEPLKQALLEVLREMPDLAPGQCHDNFHIQPVGTHMAAVDRLRETSGYQFFGASEGGPILCPSWPTSCNWNQGTHINWQRYLDAATGAMLRMVLVLCFLVE